MVFISPNDARVLLAGAGYLTVFLLGICVRWTPDTGHKITTFQGLLRVYWKLGRIVCKTIYFSAVGILLWQCCLGGSPVEERLLGSAVLTATRFFRLAFPWIEYSKYPARDPRIEGPFQGPGDCAARAVTHLFELAFPRIEYSAYPGSDPWIDSLFQGPSDCLARAVVSALILLEIYACTGNELDVLRIHRLVTDPGAAGEKWDFLRREARQAAKGGVRRCFSALAILWTFLCFERGMLKPYHWMCYCFRIFDKSVLLRHHTVVLDVLTVIVLHVVLAFVWRGLCKSDPPRRAPCCPGAPVDPRFSRRGMKKIE